MTNTVPPPKAQETPTPPSSEVITPATAEASPALPEPADGLFTAMEQALTREGEIFHATLIQVSESTLGDAVSPRWSGEIWLDVGRDTGRIEFRPDPDAPASDPWRGPGSAPGASTAVVVGDEFYLARNDQQVWNSTVVPCPEMGEFSLVVYLVCGSAISPWAPDYPFFGGSWIWPEQDLTVQQDVEYLGRTAIALSFDAPPTTTLYLDAETHLPLAWESDQMESGTLVTTITTEFIPAPALDANLFAPASVGHVEPGVPSGMVAFMQQQNGNPDIVVVNADGSGERNLTNHPAADIFPDWSPDGRQLVFASDRSGDAEIYSMDADGSNVTRLTNNPTPDVRPLWSPDGERIAFQSDRDGTTVPELYVMDADGSNVIRLSSMDHAEFPAWSPDGSQIAFSAQDLYVVNADGSGETQLTAGNLTANVQWTADGRQLVFSTFDLDAGNADIMVSTVDGSELTVLTQDSTYDLQPYLSPDGQNIVFLSQRGEQNSELQLGLPIYIMQLDGSEQAPLLELSGNAYCDDGCGWVPSGSHFAFVVRSLNSSGDTAGSAEAWDAGASGIYLVSVDGRIVTRITARAAQAMDWRP